jgi:pheromone shutdown protein TraB
MAAGALVAVVCLVVIVGRLDSGAYAGVGTVVYGVSLACAGLSVELARRARTRWAMMAIILAAAGASLADAMP